MARGTPSHVEPATLADIVRFHARLVPDREAAIYGTRRLTYRDLARELDRYAGAFRAAGVGPGDRIAMLSTPRPEFLLALLASMQLGALWVGLNPRYQLPELRFVLGHCQPKLLIAMSELSTGRSFEADVRALAADVESLEHVVTLDASWAGVSTRLETFLAAAEGAETSAASHVPRRADPAVIVYTSGSTGRPKGAVLPNSSFFHSHAALSESFAGHEGVRAAHRIICNLPINHVGCQADVCGNALIDGGTIVFMDSFEPARIPAVIERERITILGGMPLMHQQVFDQAALDRVDLSSLEAIAWGGAPMPRALLERLQDAGYLFSMHYGLTEGGSINSVSHPGSSLDVLTETIGWPDHDHDYRVMTAAGAAADVGEIGEIQVRGHGVMLGYYSDVEATRAAFTDDGWLRTADLVECRADGAWRFVGRSTEMFKSGGYNVYPREVELALETCPAVAAAAVVGIPHQTFGEVGWAFVVPAARTPLDESLLRAHAAACLANYKIPKRFVLVDSLPVLAVGKVDKRALRARAIGMSGAT